jgi:hypothetical protein
MIWRKEFQGPTCNFWKVARGIFGNIFEFQGSGWNFSGLWLDFRQVQGGSLQSGEEFLLGIHFE